MMNVNVMMNVMVHVLMNEQQVREKVNPIQPNPTQHNPTTYIYIYIYRCGLIYSMHRYHNLKEHPFNGGSSTRQAASIPPTALPHPSSPPSPVPFSWPVLCSVCSALCAPALCARPGAPPSRAQRTAQGARAAGGLGWRPASYVLSPLGQSGESD